MGESHRDAENGAVEIRKAASRLDEIKAKAKDAGELAEAATNLATAVATYGPLIGSLWTWIGPHISK